MFKDSINRCFRNLKMISRGGHERISRFNNDTAPSFSHEPANDGSSSSSDVVKVRHQYEMAEYVRDA